jgi:hypothetical protein
MEDVLDVYARPYDPVRPVVCFDESPYQLIGETRQPLLMLPGEVARYDYEYKRNGGCNLFMMVEPLGRWRHVAVTERRTKQDVAYQLRDLVDVHFPLAEAVVVVMDNLNTHTLSVLYEVFPAAEARRIARRLEVHFTPKHGSWLNMAEIELGVLADQCLDRRLPAIAVVHQEVAAWTHDRNAKRASITWRFTTEQARDKLERLYPSQDELRRAYRVQDEMGEVSASSDELTHTCLS